MARWILYSAIILHFCLLIVPHASLPDQHPQQMSSCPYKPCQLQLVFLEPTKTLSPNIQTVCAPQLCGQTSIYFSRIRSVLATAHHMELEATFLPSATSCPSPHARVPTSSFLLSSSLTVVLGPFPFCKQSGSTLSAHLISNSLSPRRLGFYSSPHHSIQIASHIVCVILHLKIVHFSPAQLMVVGLKSARGKARTQ